MKQRKATIYKRGIGWGEETFTIQKTFNVKQPQASKVYEVWEDSRKDQYWVILNQEVNLSITADEAWVEKILDYSQQDNWVIETYSFNSDYCITKYYPNYYPNIINEGSADLYSIKEYEDRVLSHYIHFDNPNKHLYFRDVNGFENLPISDAALKNREKFYKEAIKQHEAFSDRTGCFFDDIDPNNFLVSGDFSDIKIIDVCCITPGDIRDYYNTSDPHSMTWPLKDHRIVGPVWSDSFFKKAYHG